MKKFRILICFAALVCSCEIPFAIDDISEPRFLVECVPAAGNQSFTIMVAYADAAYSKTRAGKYPFKSNNVEISVNDKKLSTGALEWEQNGNFFIASVPGTFVPGDRVSVNVKGDSMPTASGSTVIPKEPKLADLTITKATSKQDSTALRVSLKLADKPGDDDYYGLVIKVVEEMYYVELMMEPPFFKRDTTHYSFSSMPGQVASMEDINNMDLDAFAEVQYEYGGLVNRHFGENYSYSPMALLSSRQFDGNTYTFYLNASYSFFDDILDGMGDYDGGTSEPDYTDYPDYSGDNEEPGSDPDDSEEPGDWDDPDDWEDPDEPTEYKIPIGSKTWYQLEVYHLSEELYNYCKAQYLKDFNILSNFGVTPPNFTYSNISGGIGIIGGISRFTPEKVPDPDNKEPEMPSMQDLLKLLQ